MGSTTEIAWTDSTWNPVVGCTPASPGCANCYARETHDKRHRAKLAGKLLPAQYLKPFSALQCFPERLDKPLHWKKPRRIFVCSTADLFHPDVPFKFIEAVFGVMAATPRHTYQVLTKRPERMVAWFTQMGGARFPDRRCSEAADAAGAPVYKVGRNGRSPWNDSACLWPLPNVWIGTTVEDQARSDERIPLLLQVPAARRFVSVEPMLGPVRLDHLDADAAGHERLYQVNVLTGRHTDMGRPCADVPRLDWVICGGESGPRARQFDVAWARSLREQCRAAGVPFFMKQLGRNAVDAPTNWRAWRAAGSSTVTRSLLEARVCTDSLDGRDPAEWPQGLRVREMPEVRHG